MNFTDHCGALSVKVLYLRNNALYDITYGILANSHNLMVIRSDWYIMCCVLDDVENCQPKGQLVSTCKSLLSLISLTVFLTAQAVTTTIGNGVILLKFLITEQKQPDRPLMFSLVSADAMMGVCLFILVIMDLYTHGRFHEYVAQWTKSNICLAASVLNFVSSEASLCILTALSIIRAAGIHKVGGLREMKKTIISATLCAWGFTFVMTGLYVLSYERGKLRLRNNMCIILGISHQRHVSEYEQIFQVVVIGVNSVLLLSLCAGIFAMFITVYRSQKKITGLAGKTPMKAQKRTSKTGGKLMLLLFFNLLCWIPIICIAGILLSEVNVNGDILSWLAALFIPISATTDPFLYNIHIFKKPAKK